MATVALPTLQFFARDSEGLSLLVGPPFVDGAPSKLDKVPCTAARFSSDGGKLAVTTAEAVVLYDTTSSKEILSLPISGVLHTAFSPCGTYLQTFQKPVGQQKNLTLWNSSTGEICFQVFQKTASKANWPAIQFSEHDAVACRLVTNEVHIYDGTDFQRGIVDKLRVPDITAVRLAPAPPSHLAVYVPEKKGVPASVCIFDRARVKEGQLISRRSFYQSDTAQLIWNKISTGLLVFAQSNVDNTNKSYYGQSRLHFLASDGSHEGGIPLNKEGPIHDAQWAPSGNGFVVLYGFMPARATLFDNKCKALFDFGSGPYNTIRWSPHDHFICLAGFGNLPGEMAFWDRHTLKQIGATKAPLSVTSEWGPDGRTFMTATTAPRLQVDNGIKFFKYDGTLYHEKKYEKLYQAEWQPAPSELYPDRPSSPKLTKPASKQSQSTAKQPASTPKPAAYRPPNASSAAAVKAQLFGEEEKTGGGLSKSALKNQKRRANKQKDSSEAVAVDTSREKSHSDATAGVSDMENQMNTVTLDGSLAASGGVDNTKKLRALHKKLRQLEELRSKLSGSGSSSLTAAQQEKLNQEAALREEIKTLESQQ